MTVGITTSSGVVPILRTIGPHPHDAEHFELPHLRLGCLSCRAVVPSLATASVSTTITPPGPTATWSISLLVPFAPGTRRLFSTVHSGPSLLSASEVQSSPNAPTRQEIDPSVVSKDQTTPPTRMATAKPAPTPRQNGGIRVTKGIRPRSAMSATPLQGGDHKVHTRFRKRIEVMRRAMVVSSRPGTPRTDAFRTEQQLPHRLNAIDSSLGHNQIRRMWWPSWMPQPSRTGRSVRHRRGREPNEPAHSDLEPSPVGGRGPSSAEPEQARGCAATECRKLIVHRAPVGVPEAQIDWTE